MAFFIYFGCFFAAATAGGYQLLIKKSRVISRICAILLCFAAVFSAGLFFHDVYENKYSATYYDMTDIMSHSDHTPFQKLLVQISGAEYLPAGMDLDEVWLLNSPNYAADQLAVSDYEKSSLTVSFSVENQSDTSQPITVPLIGYKGYHAYANGQEIPVARSEKGQVELSIPAHFDGFVQILFREPVLWRVSEIISLVFLCILIAFFIKRSFLARKHLTLQENSHAAIH